MTIEEKQRNTLEAAIKVEETIVCGAVFDVEIPKDERERITICGEKYEIYGVIPEKFKKIFEDRWYTAKIISETEKSTILEFYP